MRRSVTRRSLLASIGGVASLAGCLGSGGPDGDNADSVGRSGPSTDADRMPPAASGPLPLPMDGGRLRDHAVSGGVGKDGIPAIDDPSFVGPSEARGLDPGDPVFGIAGESDAKAYPQSILVHHEICNDTIDGTPVAVTYCPLTGTAMGFGRGATTFGVSGQLVNNNLIMYDRATETWWPQVLATAIPGPWHADPPRRSLKEFRLVWTTWNRWRSTYPETSVLSRNTGFARNYDRDPYGSYNPPGGYYTPGASPMFPPIAEDDRLQPKTVVIGTRTPNGAVSFKKQTLRDENILHGAIDGTPVVAVYDPELDTGYAYANPESRSLTVTNGAITTGGGERHDPSSLPLDRLLAFDAMWFAWSGFYPESSLIA